MASIPTIDNNSKLWQRLTEAQAGSNVAYLLFDGARLHMQRMIYELCKNPEWIPLFLNSPYEHILDLSPGVVRLDNDGHLLNWYLKEGAEAGSGVLFFSDKPLEEIAAHFKSYLEVVIPNEKKQVVLFRFFDPFVLNEYLPSLKPHEQDIFMSPIKSLWWADCNSGQMTLTWHEVVNNKTALCDSSWHYGFRLLSDQSYTALSGVSSKDFEENLKEKLLFKHPQLPRLLNDQSLDSYIKLHIAETTQAGIMQPDKVTSLLQMRFLWGWHFWDELEFMIGDRLYYLETPLLKESVNDSLPILNNFMARAYGLDPNPNVVNGDGLIRQEAFRRVRAVYFSKEARIGRSEVVAGILKSLYPEKITFMGDIKLQRLVVFADNLSDEMGLPENVGSLCCSMIFLFFGLGAFSDPLLSEWTAKTFAKPLNGNPTQWSEQLLKVCCIDIPEWGSL